MYEDSNKIIILRYYHNNMPILFNYITKNIIYKSLLLSLDNK